MIANFGDRSEINDHSWRRGLASVAVLIALIVIAIIGAGLLRVALARRAEVGMEERRLQSEWLAGSGVERALARLSRSDDYTGETWEIPPEDFGGRGPATVAIQVDRVADEAGRRKVRVRAEYPAGSSLRSRQSREILVQLKSSAR